MSQVHDGTPEFRRPSLCQSCRHAHRIRGEREREVQVICQERYDKQVEVDWKVTECNRYSDATKPTLYEMQKMAHILVAKGERVGFVANRKFRTDNDLGEHDDLVPPTLNL